MLEFVLEDMIDGRMERREGGREKRREGGRERVADVTGNC